MKSNQRRIEALKELFPEVVEGNEINTRLLQKIISVNNTNSELYWEDKDNAIKELSIEPEGILNIESTVPHNMLIEGDNLTVLKHLKNKFENTVDVIYIDPPYNTGNSFIYKDYFSGHSSWLSMMYPRLKIARDFLTPEGVIFVSIDENECSHLKILCDEIFEEDNFIGSFIWKCRTGANDKKNNFSSNHEFILCYAKQIEKVKFKGVPKDFSKYKNPDNDPNGPWIKDNPSAASGNDSMNFPIVNPYTGEVYQPPKGRYWAFSEKTFNRYVEEGKVIFPEVKGKRFILKRYLKDIRNKYKPNSSLEFVEEKQILTSQGTKELKRLFNTGSPFPYPKPSQLIVELLKMVEKKDAIVLDFFAGSGTTAHAVLSLNQIDRGDRKFILVQRPEELKKSFKLEDKELHTIFDITEERIERVINELNLSLYYKKYFIEYV